MKGAVELTTLACNALTLIITFYHFTTAIYHKAQLSRDIEEVRGHISKRTLTINENSSVDNDDYVRKQADVHPVEPVLAQEPRT